MVQNMESIILNLENKFLNLENKVLKPICFDQGIDGESM